MQIIVTLKWIRPDAKRVRSSWRCPRRQDAARLNFNKGAFSFGLGLRHRREPFILQPVVNLVRVGRITPSHLSNPNAWHGRL